jgi:hypothetical protein
VEGSPYWPLLLLALTKSHTHPYIRHPERSEGPLYWLLLLLALTKARTRPYIRHPERSEGPLYWLLLLSLPLLLSVLRFLSSIPTRNLPQHLLSTNGAAISQPRGEALG